MTNNEMRRSIATGEFPTLEGRPNKMVDVAKAWEKLKSKECPSPEMTDWLEWPAKYLGSPEYERLNDIAECLSNCVCINYDAIVFVGIGGSYLSGKMLVTTMCGEYHNNYSSPEVYFAGHDMDPDSICDLCGMLTANNKWAIVYISKSGGTFEPAAVFNILYSKLVSTYGDTTTANKHVYAITDSTKGILKKAADENGWTSFVIPDGIGGRFSGFTPVGLLPAAIAGLNTDNLLMGAAKAISDCNKDPNALAFQYANWRHSNVEFDTAHHFDPKSRWYHGRVVEYMATNYASISELTEWWKQIFGESEGKSGMGIFPTSGVFPRDLHSIGQFLRDGTNDIIFETQLICSSTYTDCTINSIGFDDGLAPFYGKTLSQATEAAMHGAYVSHTNGGIPCGIIRFEKNEYSIGNLMMHWMISAAISAMMFKVNPFDQPGVEEHKRVMKKTLLNSD